MAYRLIRTEDFNSYVLNDFVIDDFSDTASISNDYSDIISPGWTARIVKQGNTKKYLFGADMQWCEMHQRSKIPDEYVEVEYIRGTGTQYINTNIKPTRTMTMELTVSDITSPSGGASLVGAKSGESTYQIFHTPYNGGSLYGRFFGTNFNTTISENLSDKLIITLDGASHSLIVKNETAGTQPVTQVIPDGSGSDIDYQMFIFAMNNAGNIATLSICNIHKFVIKDIDGIKCNFIPVVRLADNKPGMYDTVTKTFFTNQGTGEFILGRYKKLPIEYQQVEYIESTGTQYIDTGIFGTQYTELTIDFQPTTSVVSGNNKTLIGSWADAPYSLRFYSSGAFFFYGSDRTDDGHERPLDIGTDRHLFKIQSNKLYFDGNLEKTYTLNDFTTGKTLTIFGQNQTSSVGRLASIRLFSLKMKQGSSYYFVPCYYKADGKIGLYELIGKSFYTNDSGTGVFLKGPDVN